MDRTEPVGGDMMRNSGFAERRTVSGVFGGLLGLLAMSSAGGLLVAVAVTPVVALSSIAATDTINVFENLPEYLSIDRLSQKSNIYATRSDGTTALLASFYDQNRIEVGLDAISPYVKDAAIASEDPRFFEHGGVDFQGTVRAAVSTFAGGATQGGSSITQQYVKNVLVQKCEVLSDVAAQHTCYLAATETSPDRKLKEMRLAIGIEKKYSKNDILRQYLNIAGFGGTVYGIEAAANYYFHTTAANLTLPQAASLVAIVNNPVKFQLDDPQSETNGAANGYQANRTRRDYILRDMLAYRKITRAEFDAAIVAPVEPSIAEPSTGCQTAAGSAFFCDYVTHVLRNDPSFGADEAARLVNFRRGGYNVYTTIDLDLQNAAETAIRANVPTTYPGWDVGSVISSVQVGTGRVLAMAQNKDYSQDPVVQATGANFTGINYNTDYVDGGSSGFQPGSTYKVFTLAEWLREGHSLNERVDSRRKANWGTFKDSCLGPQNYDRDKWNPKNDANESGANYSALEATIGSINTGYIGMAKKLDLCGIRQTAEAFGMHRADGDPLLQNAASVIGTNEIAPLSMAVAFAGIANKGVTCTPVVIDRIVAADGTELPVPKSQCTQSVDPAVTAGMAYAMRLVMTSGTAQASYRATSPRVPMIGKTGTTDGNKDTWMSGTSTKVATVVAVVSLTGETNQRAVYFDSGQAATARHRMWPAVMSVANAKYGGDAFAEAPPSAVIKAGTGPR
ncbi:penicillin-binding protein [Cryobacterium mannosilyticum]|uniref:Penicillin-binding protein n=2 Tax=Cryobacterium mannosilyticum TaxID=1259190 RepID=A0A4V6QGU1_9MICO|nr:penicillin-binding protein [Cryobacterium mannosilyticum]